MRTRTEWLVLLPPLLAGAGRLLAPLLPQSQVWGHVAESTLLTAPAWLMLMWPVVGAAVAWRTRRWSLFCLTLLGPLLAGVPWGSPPEGGLRVMTANVNAYSEADPADLEAALAAHDLDVLVLIEDRGRNVRGLTAISDNRAQDLERTSHVMTIYCRSSLECQALVTEEIGSETIKMSIGLVRVQGICLIGLHSPPPVPFDPSGLFPYIDEISGHIGGGRLQRAWGPCRENDPVVIAGDFNQVPGSHAYRRIMTPANGLVDALKGRGVWGASWPAGGGWPNTPFFRLDQLLVGDGVRVSGEQILRIPGADHKALLFLVAASAP